MLKVTISITLIIQTICDQIYPILTTNEKQLENDGWIDCQLKTEISPINCQGNDLLWLECYLIPENGLCSKQNIATQSSESLNFAFTFYQFTDTQVQIYIDDLQYEPVINVESSLTRVIIEAQSQNAQIKILNKGQKFTGLTISKNCLPNCDNCENGFCYTGCQQDYFYYNYRCSKFSCEEQINLINTQSLLSSEGNVQDNNYILKLQFDFQMGDCLIPKIYYTYSLTNSQIKFILQENQIIYNDQSTLQITLPIEQVIKNCDMINTSTSFVYSCYIGVAITHQQFTQYLAVLIGQISVNRETQSTTQYTQSIVVPSDNSTQVGPVFVISETLYVSLNENKRLFTVLQTISDTEFSDFRITYYQAYIIQNNQTYNLSLESEIQKNVNTTFQFSYTTTKFDPTQEYQLYVNSLASPQSYRRRTLAEVFKREELKVNYKAKNTYTYFPTQNEFTPTFNNSKMVGILVGAFGGVILLVIGISYLDNKIRAKQVLN